MGEAATNNHLTMEEEPFSAPQAFGWRNSAIRIGGAVVHGIAGSAPLIFSCVCLFLAYKKRQKPSKKMLLQRSMSLAALHGGKMTLHNIILASSEVKHDSSVVNLASQEFKRLLRSDPMHFTNLQKEAAKLEMTGQEDEAVKLLSEAYEEAKKNKSHEAYELEMLLVEMLIYQGNFENALDRDCMKEEEITDARRLLYEATIHIMLGNINDARSAYEKFLDMQRNYLYFDNPMESFLHDTGHNFVEFKKIVSNLKEQIKHARANKPHTETPPLQEKN